MGLAITAIGLLFLYLVGVEVSELTHMLALLIGQLIDIEFAIKRLKP